MNFCFQNAQKQLEIFSFFIATADLELESQVLFWVKRFYNIVITKVFLSFLSKLALSSFIFFFWPCLWHVEVTRARDRTHATVITRATIHSNNNAGSLTWWATRELLNPFSRYPHTTWGKVNFFPDILPQRIPWSPTCPRRHLKFKLAKQRDYTNIAPGVYTLHITYLHFLFKIISSN